jgi:hypothetical protein
MNFGVTVLFYLVIGAAVATALDLAQGGGASRPRRVFVAASALVFWPLYLPVVLAGPRARPDRAEPGRSGTSDELARAIAQVEAELDAAFSSLDGWAEGVLAREEERIGELRSAWTSQAARIREIDALLARLAGEPAAVAVPAADPQPHASPRSASESRRAQSEQARLANLARLKRVRDHAYDELTGTLAWVRELVSMIHLARFTGAPASRAEELAAQIAAAVEGISAVAWNDLDREAAGTAGTKPNSMNSWEIQ